MKSAAYYIHKPGQLNHLKQEEIYVAHKYDDLAASIIQHVGGKDNIHNLAHCFTRLRFTLKDETKVNQEALRKTQGVIQLVMAGGQCQVVVGSKVDALYDLIRQTCGLGEDSLDGGDEGSHQHNPINALMNTMSGVLAPTLGILTAAGIIKGVISLFASLGWVSTASGVYMLLYAVGDGFFYFLPILLGFSAARRFKCSEYLGAAIGTALVYPAMVNIGSTLEVAGTILAGTPFAMDYYNTLFGIPIIMPGSGYTSSVIPIMLAVYLASKLEKAFKQSLPEAIRGILTPVLVLVITVPLTYIVIGPVSQGICGAIFMVVKALYEWGIVGGILAGALVGGGFGVLVMFGLHWVIISLALSNIGINGFDYIMASGGIGPMIGVAQGLCITLRTRSKKVRDLALPSFISQVCGVGEPLMYSILIPLKKPYVINILSGAVGGAPDGFGPDLLQPSRSAPYRPLEDHAVLELGGVQVQAIPVPGHTAGMMVFLIPEDRIALFGDACGEMTLLKKEALPAYAQALRHLQTYESQFDTVLRNHGTFWSDKRILRDNLALTEEILAGQDAAVPLQMMGVSGFAGRPQEHPGKFGNIFYAAARDASW